MKRGFFLRFLERLSMLLIICQLIAPAGVCAGGAAAGQTDEENLLSRAAGASSFASLFTRSAYDEPSNELLYTSALYADKAYEGKASDLEQLGFNDVVTDYSTQNIGDDVVAYMLGWMDVSDGRGGTQPLIAVVVRGTHGTAAEWISNFNVGTSDYHAGFYAAAGSLLTALKDYMNRRIAEGDVGSDEQVKFWLTGHSRGAAVVNILAATHIPGWYANTSRRDIYAFGFATPNVALGCSALSCDHVRSYNIPGDLIPMLPLSQWGYGRYGKTILLDNFSSAPGVDLMKPEDSRKLMEAFCECIPDSRVFAENFERIIDVIKGISPGNLSASTVYGAVLTANLIFKGGIANTLATAVSAYISGFDEKIETYTDRIYNSHWNKTYIKLVGGITGTRFESQYPYETEYYERAVYRGDGTADNRIKVLPYSGSDVGTIDSYTTEELTVVAAVRNKHGNIWYRLENGGYVYSGDVVFVRSAPLFDVKGTASPTGSLKQGSAFYNNKGAITSSDCITKVVGGVYQGNVCVTGAPITAAVSGKLTKSYSMVNSPIAYNMKFGTLPPGDYTYRIDVYHGVHGLCTTVIETKFSVVENASSGGEAVGTLMISDVAYPSKQQPGKGTYARGTIRSDAAITSVTASIYDSTGARISHAAASPNAMSYDLLSLDSSIRFALCSKANSSYSYIITAEDEAGRRLSLWMQIDTGSSSSSQVISHASRTYVEPELVHFAEAGAKEYLYYSSTMDWEDARDYAESLGGCLAVINSEEEQALLYEQLPISSGYYYLGGQYVGGEFCWINGEEADYTNFSSGEPNCRGGLQRDIIIKANDGQWADIFCGDTILYGFIVERKKEGVISDLFFTEGEAYQMPAPGVSWNMASEVGIFPEDADCYDLTFTSSDESVVYCSEDGTNVYPCRYGFAYVTVYDSVSGLSASIPFGAPENGLPESVHEYRNDTQEHYAYSGSWEYTFVTFSEDTCVEENFDWIGVWTEEDAYCREYTGRELAGKTIFLPGRSFSVSIESDESVSAFGFRITAVDGFVESSLTRSAVLPADVRRIEAGAFEGSRFETVRLDSCEFIGARAFADSEALRIVYIGEDCAGIRIADDAFEGCGNLVFFLSGDSAYIEEYAEAHGFFTYYVR